MSSSLRLRTVVFATFAIAAVVATVTRNAGARTVPPRRAKTVEVKMVTQNGMQMFEPKQITIQAGDTVKWVAVSGSHNVAFWADSLPEGAADLLRKAMPDTIAPLTGPRKPTPGDSYVIVFAGMPKGDYKYYCRPHLMRGMIASITVE